MHSMTEEAVSGSLQALPRPLPLDSVYGGLQPALSEEAGLKPSLPQLQTKRSDSSTNSVSALKAGHLRKEEGISLQTLAVISGYGMLSEQLIFPDASMPSHLEGKERRQAALEEPQVAREASLADSHRPLECAKTPDVSAYASSHQPPELEPVDMEGQEAQGPVADGAEDRETLQLPVLQPEEGSAMMREKELGEEKQSELLVTCVQKEAENGSSLVTSTPDHYWSSESIKSVEDRKDAARSTKTLPDCLRKTPVVVLTRLPLDVLNALVWPSHVSRTKTKDLPQQKPLTVRVDQSSYDQNMVESIDYSQSKKKKYHQNQAKLQERLSPLNPMLEQWSQLPEREAASQVSSHVTDVHLDENSNNEPEKFSDNPNTSTICKGDSGSKTLTSSCNNKKGASVLKKRLAVKPPQHRDADRIELEKKALRQHPPLLQPYTSVSNSNHSPVLSKHADDKIRKELSVSVPHSKDTHNVGPTSSYTTFSPGALKMTFISCNKSSMTSVGKSADDVRTESGKTSATEPAVHGWENCPDVIFDCGSQGSPVLAKASDSVSRNSVRVNDKDKGQIDDAGSVIVSTDAEAVSLSHRVHYVHEAKSQVFTSDQDHTHSRTCHTNVPAMEGGGAASISLPQSDNTTAATYPQHNAAESLAEPVPSSLCHNISSRSGTQSLGSSRNSERQSQVIAADVVYKQIKESNRIESATRVSNNRPLRPLPSGSVSQKNDLNRLSPTGTTPGSHAKTVINGMQINVQVNRLQKSALPLKSVPVSRGDTTAFAPVHPHIEPENTQQRNRKDVFVDTIQKTLTAVSASDREALIGQEPSCPITVHVNGLQADHGSEHECSITCIEKTSPAFVIPHQEEKMVESDMVVMQKYYYSTLQSRPEVTTVGVSGCCQCKSGNGARESTSTYCRGSEHTSVELESDTHLLPALTAVQEGSEPNKHEQGLSNQSYLDNSGILMVNTNATKTFPIKISPGRRREFRSLSEVSDANVNTEYQDIAASSVVVDVDCLHRLDATCAITWTSAGAGQPGNPKKLSCKTLAHPAMDQAQKDDCLCEMLDAKEQRSMAAVHGTESMQVKVSSLQDEVLVEVEESNMPHSFDEIMGRVQIRQDDEEYDEVFDIVNERDVPIPHEAFLHSLSLLRNTGPGMREPSPKPPKKPAFGSFGLDFFPDRIENHDGLDEDSDATLPYPRDEKRERSKSSTKSKKQKRLKRGKKRKAARSTKTNVFTPEKPAETSKSKARPRNAKSQSPTPNIKLPEMVKSTPARRTHKSPQRKKSTTRHPLFKQRQQAASRRAKDLSKPNVSRPTASTSHSTPARTSQSATMTKASSTFASMTKQSTSFSSLSSKSSESDCGGSSPLPSLTRESRLPEKLAEGSVSSTMVLTTSTYPKSSAAREVSKRGTIAINSVLPPAARAAPVRSLSSPKKAAGDAGGSGGRRGAKRKLATGKAAERDAAGKMKTAEMLGSIFEGSRLTDESDTDELPTIVPPKRRRQQTSQRSRKTVVLGLSSAEKAASAAAAVEVQRTMQKDSWLDSQDVERIMREFPKHNWLENKIRQKSTYTQPQGSQSSPISTESTESRGSPKAVAKRAEPCNVLDRTHPLESPGSCAPPRSQSHGDTAPAVEKNQAPVVSSPLGIIHPRTCNASFGSSPFTSQAVSQYTSPLTVTLQSTPPIAVSTSCGAICPPNFLHVEMVSNSGQLAPRAQDRVTLPCSEQTARGLGRTGQAVDTQSTPETLSQTAQPLPVSYASRIVSGPCPQPAVTSTISSRGAAISGSILVPISLGVPSASFPVIPLMTPVAGMPMQVTRLSNVPVVTSLPCFTAPAAGRQQVMPMQPHIAPKRFAFQPVSSPPANLHRTPLSTASPSEGLTTQTITPSAACVDNLHPSEEDLLSPADLSPGRLHIDIGRVSPTIEDSLTPALLSTPGKKRASSCTTDLSQTNPVPMEMYSAQSELSVFTQDNTNTTTSDLNTTSLASSAPVQLASTPNPLQRSKSSGDLLVMHGGERQQNGETPRSTEPGSVCGTGRRKSWEQTHRDLHEGEDVEVTLIELASRTTSEVAAAVLEALPASVTTSSTITIGTPAAAAAAESGLSLSSQDHDRPLPPLVQTTSLPLSGSPQPQPVSSPPHPPAHEPHCLPPPPSLICTTASSSSSSTSRSREGEEMNGEEHWRVEKAEDMLLLTAGCSEPSGVPLDLCTQKSDLLANSSSRARTNPPPVQLVLPQVQPRSDIIMPTTPTTTTTTTTCTTTPYITNTTSTSATSSTSTPPAFNRNDLIASYKLMLKFISESLGVVTGDRLSEEGSVPNLEASRDEPREDLSVSGTSKAEDGSGGEASVQRGGALLASGFGVSGSSTGEEVLLEGGGGGGGCGGGHSVESGVTLSGAGSLRPSCQGEFGAHDPPQVLVKPPESEPQTVHQESQVSSSSSRPPARGDLALSPQASDSAEEEHLRSQLRELEQMAAQKMQEREQLLKLHKRKAEMLTEMESKRMRLAGGSSRSAAVAVDAVTDTSTAFNPPVPPESSMGGAGSTQDRGLVDRELSEQLLALQRVLVSALSSLPQVGLPNQEGLCTQPQPAAPASVPAHTSAAAEPSAGTSTTGVLDLSSGKKESGPSAENRQHLVQIIAQAIQLVTHNTEKMEKPEGQTKEADRTAETDGSLRPAHQMPKGAGCPPADVSLSPSPLLLNSPYVRRQLPLHEPPVLGIRHHQTEVAPKSAHSQPPFQPAGSLIVPAISTELTDKTAASTTSHKQDDGRVESERPEEQGSHIVHSKSSGGIPHKRNVIDLTREIEDVKRPSELREKYGAKGKDGDVSSPMDVSAAVFRTSRYSDIATVSQPLPGTPSDRPKMAVPVAAPDASDPRLPCPEDTMARGGVFPPSSSKLSHQDSAYRCRMQQQAASGVGKRIEKGDMLVPVRSSGDSSLHPYPVYRDRSGQSGQHELRHAMDSCPTQLGMPRMPVSLETHSADSRPPINPTGHPGNVRYASPLPLVQEQTVVLRNPMDDTPMTRQTARMSAGVPSPSEYASKSIPQPQPPKRLPGQSTAFQQQPGPHQVRQQPQHSSYMPSRHQLQQQVVQHAQHHQLSGGHHVPHTAGPSVPTSHSMIPPATLSSGRPNAFSHLTRVPYSGVHPTTVPLSHMGLPGVPPSAMPHAGVNHPGEVHPPKGTHMPHFGSVPAGVPMSHASSFYSQGVGVRAGDLTAPGQQLHPGLPPSRQHIRPPDLEHMVRTSPVGSVRSAYYQAPRPPHPSIVEPPASKRMRVSGAPVPGTHTFSPSSQPYSLPPGHHHPHPTAQLPPPHHAQTTQQMDALSTSAQQAVSSQTSNQQHNAGTQQQQMLPSPNGASSSRRNPKKGVCELCGALAMYLCSLCRAVWYCSQHCQGAHWRTHSAVCKQPKS